MRSTVILPLQEISLRFFSVNNHQEGDASLASRGTKLKKPVAVMLLESAWLHLSCFPTIWVNKVRTTRRAAEMVGSALNPPGDQGSVVYWGGAA